MQTRKLKIIDLQKPDLSQSRVSTDPETISKYKAAWEAGIDFPEVVVYQDGDKYHIADGFHRVQSLMHANLKQKVEHRTICCDVRSGTLQDAIVYSLGANLKHGLLPSTADKKRAVLLYYGLNPEHCAHSSNTVSKVVGCSHTFVSGWKATCTSTPISIIQAETKIPIEVLEQTISNLKAAIAEGKIVTVRNGEQLVQAQKTSPRSMELIDSTPVNQLYIVTTTASAIPRGTVIEGFESLTEIGHVACPWEFGTEVIPSGDLIKIPYSIDTKVVHIDGAVELAVTGYSLVSDDLKIQCTDQHGYACTHSSTMLRPYQPKKSSINDEDKPTPPILDLTVLSTKQLQDIIAVIGTEIHRRSLSENAPDLTIT